MSFTGYRLYRGEGGLASVDFSFPVAEAGPSADSIVAGGAPHAAGAAYTYVLRPVIDDLESPDISCATEVAFDAAGDWIGATPAPVEALRYEQLAGGRVRLRWRSGRQTGAAEPEAFAVFVCAAARIDPAAEPVAIVAADRLGQAQVELSLADEQTCYLAVEARAGDGCSRWRFAGPVVADATAPAAPPAVATSGF